MKNWKVLFAIGCGLLVSACGGGGSSDTANVTPVDFSGNWSGNSNGTSLKYSIAQTGSNFNMTRTEPALAGVTYTGSVNGNSALVKTYINSALAGTSTLTLSNDTTASMTVDTCTPPQGYSCAAPGSTLVLTRLTSTPATNGVRFTKTDSSGNLLVATAANWSCALDTKSGLLWEVKTDDGGLRDQDWVYTAYETIGTNGNGTCDATKSCNQSHFRDSVNVIGLCGYKDWRLAKVTELEGLQDNTKTQPPYIDTQYFPFTKSAKYWTTMANVSAANPNVWWVDFASIYSAATPSKDLKFHVRLVRP